VLQTMDTYRAVIEFALLLVAAATVLAGSVAWVWRGRLALERRLRAIEEARAAEAAAIEALRRNLDREFGGNGGGMREAINRMSTTLSAVDGRTLMLATDTTELRAKLDAHLDEHSRQRTP
jgi:hypothetical protein